jgi:WD40 repeat protein
VQLWDLKRLEVRSELGGHGRFVHAVAFTPDGTTLATVGGVPGIRLWDMATLQERTVLSTDSVVLSLAFSRDGRSLVAATFPGPVVLWRGSKDDKGPIVLQAEPSLGISGSTKQRQ